MERQSEKRLLFIQRARETGTLYLNERQRLEKKLADIESLEAELGKSLPEGDALRSKYAAYKVSYLLSPERLPGKKAMRVAKRLRKEYPMSKCRRRI